MFNNFINLSDFLEIYHFLLQHSLPALFSRIRFSKRSKIEAAWQELSFPPKYWRNIEAIHRHIANKIPGKIDFWQYAMQNYLRPLEPLTALSLCSGRGLNEIEWANHCQFKELYGIDISPKAVEFANKNAIEKNKTTLHFQIGDLTKIHLPERKYDAIMAVAALHHFSPLEMVIREVVKALRPGGFLIIDEYVGPNRFQWKKAQLEAINSLLSEIPSPFRKRWKLNVIKKKVYRPGLLRMLLADPSEAVESENILPTIKKYFKTVQLIEKGGTLLQPLFHDIAQNFSDNDPVAQEIISRIIQKEESMLRNGEISSDFIFGIFKKEA